MIKKFDGPKDKTFEMEWNTFNDKLYIATKRDMLFCNVEKKIIDKGTGWPIHDKCSTLCIGFINNDCFGLTIKGSIVRWKSNSFQQERKNAHKGPIYASCNIERKKQLITGGADGFIRIWDDN